LQARIIAQDLARAEFLSQPDIQIMEGRLLFPRFFRRNDGIFSANPWAVYEARGYPRLGFLIINDRVNNIIFPTDKPLTFRHGEDIVLFGCQRTDHVEARWVHFPALNETYQSGNFTEPCLP
jgi:hypothetical protein